MSNDEVHKKFISGAVLTKEESFQLSTYLNDSVNRLELRRPVIEAFHDFKQRHNLEFKCPECGGDDVKTSTTAQGNKEFYISCRDPDCRHSVEGLDCQAFEICEPWTDAFGVSNAGN